MGVLLERERDTRYKALAVLIITLIKERDAIKFVYIRQITIVSKISFALITKIYHVITSCYLHYLLNVIYHIMK